MSDVAGLVKGLTTDISLDVLLAVALFVLTVYVLWRMPFGLRLRSSGERPSAADSLGVPVIRYRYYGMIVSGALAGFGGAILVLFANRYQENQVGGRGFLGLATLVVGNWRPGRRRRRRRVVRLLPGHHAAHKPGATRPRPPARRGPGVGGGRRRCRVSHVVGAVRRPRRVSPWPARGCTSSPSDPNNQFVYITPFLVTLIVVSVRGQALRPPAQAGIPWRKGMQV